MAPDDPKEEYKDLSDNMRYYASSRFVHLTLFVALNGALFSAVFATNLSLQPQIIIILKVLGLLAASIFWVIEKRAVDYWNQFHDRAVQLEEQLRYHQYKVRPKRTWKTIWMNATTATSLFYFVVFFLWLTTLLAP